VTERDRAIAICRAVAADPEAGRGHYAEAAIRLGYHLRRLRGRPGSATADYIGRAAAAVELASAAWLAVDPDPLDISDPDDPRRDLAAADLLEKGWTP